MKTHVITSQKSLWIIIKAYLGIYSYVKSAWWSCKFVFIYFKSIRDAALVHIIPQNTRERGKKEPQHGSKQTISVHLHVSKQQRARQ